MDIARISKPKHIRLLIVPISWALALAVLTSGQEQSSSQPQSSAQAASDAAPASAPKKPKKVWTDENLQEVKDKPVSEVGQAQPNSVAPKSTGLQQTPSPQLVASYRKQLATLRAQQASIEKQIADFKDFQRGEPGHDVGLQLHKRYSTEPIDDQIRKLEAKQKKIAEQIDALVDAARKKGIEPKLLP
jgi:hypothetical protein